MRQATHLEGGVAARALAAAACEVVLAQRLVAPGAALRPPAAPCRRCRRRLRLVHRGCDRRGGAAILEPLLWVWRLRRRCKMLRGRLRVAPQVQRRHCVRHGLLSPLLLPCGLAAAGLTAGGRRGATFLSGRRRRAQCLVQQGEKQFRCLEGNYAQTACSR